MIFFFSLLSSKYTTKPVLIFTLIVSSFSSYFMNSYHVVIDRDMLRNALQTNMNESFDLLSFKLVLYVVFLGLLPAWLVYKSTLKSQTLKETLFSKIKTLFLSLLLIVMLLFSFSQFYTSFFREHKPLRYYTNPTYWIYSIGDYITKTMNSGSVVVKALGRDAQIANTPEEPRLVIMVVGEATRADHFSLNGYEKETNPLLKQENIINFPKMYSCGTSTAYSVPCMFSKFDRSDYSYKKGISNENVLDVLKHTNQVDILWRDNNSDSKGVALRVPYEDYKDPKKNTLCEGECRDEGMLVGLDEYIEERQDRDILIVLHQMGNHGPAYYKRYPKSFEKFSPVCETNQLEQCTSQSISNAYDNAILYTDYFLSKVIQLLKTHSHSHETSMIYMSDHGESLGENGIYLHGLPYFMAPEAQKHIASLMWFEEETKKIENTRTYLQENFFHRFLGIFEVKTKVNQKKMEIFNDI